jgi:hypothetical protein
MTLTKCAASTELTRNPHTYSKYAVTTVANWPQRQRLVSKKPRSSRHLRLVALAVLSL